MREILFWLFAMVITWCLLAAVGLAVLSWRLDRRNRVSPAAPTSAPLVWLWLPTRPAVLHRRLRNAVQVSRMAVALPQASDPTLSIPHLRQQLEDQAVVIDHHVVIAARLPKPTRRTTLRHLEHDVAQLEALSTRLTRLEHRPPGLPASGWSPHRAPGEALGEIAEQLHMLEEAKAEVDHVERTSRGVDAERVLAEGQAGMSGGTFAASDGGGRRLDEPIERTPRPPAVD